MMTKYKVMKGYVKE